MSEALSPNTTIAQHTIVSKLGEGGWVYLADDARLRRRVALKILPPHLAADGDRPGPF